MFRTGEKTGFERMLDGILGRAKIAALNSAAQVEAEFAARGVLMSSGTPSRSNNGSRPSTKRHSPTQ